MPIVSEFYGYEVGMFQLADPVSETWPPYFHVAGNEQKATIDIANGATLDGGLSQRGQAIIEDWRRENVVALITNWTAMSENSPPNIIPPLD